MAESLGSTNIDNEMGHKKRVVKRVNNRSVVEDTNLGEITRECRLVEQNTVSEVAQGIAINCYGRRI